MCVYFKKDGLSLVEVAVGVLMVSLGTSRAHGGVPAGCDVGVVRFYNLNIAAVVLSGCFGCL